MYSRTNPTHYLRLLIISLGCLILSSCKYVELYRFSQQFCELDEYIALELNNNSTNVKFNTPTLSRTLLLRYLGATPISSRHEMIKDNSDATDEFVSRDHFRIEKNSESKERFDFFLDYHELSKKSLLQNARLDSNLSRLFKPEFVRPILASFCTDDYDIEDEYVDLRFQLDNIPSNLPKRPQLIGVFGAPNDHTKNSYRFRFSQQPDTPAEKEIFFQFDFDNKELLSKLSIKYYRYDYKLDFKSGAGRLIVSR